MSWQAPRLPSLDSCPLPSPGNDVGAELFYRLSSGQAGTSLVANWQTGEEEQW